MVAIGANDFNTPADIEKRLQLKALFWRPHPKYNFPEQFQNDIGVVEIPSLRGAVEQYVNAKVLTFISIKADLSDFVRQPWT